MKFVLVTFLIICIDLSCSKKYTNYTLYRVVPIKTEEIDYLQNLTFSYNSINFWREPGLLQNPVDFLIGPEERDKFKNDMDTRRMYYTTILPDVQSAFDSQTVKTYIRRKMDTFDWKSFYKLKDIYNWYQDLAQLYPSEVSILTIGHTYEKRPILAVRVALRNSRRRSVVIVEGGIHAREWIAPAFVTYMMNEIINSKYSKNTLLREIALLHEWYFVPVLNPDGYEYSHNNDRMWRKNRNNVHGADINRNFDIGFGTVGVSKSVTDETFCGEYAFSEQESYAMSKFITSKSKQLEYYLAFHSYGQYMIIPYANSKIHQDNFDVVKRMLDTAKIKLAQRYGTSYKVGTAYDTVGYTTSGVSGCWTKRQFQTPYVATFELRDSGKFGFALPPYQILPTCYETMDAMLSILAPKSSAFPLSLPAQDVIRIAQDGQAKNLDTSVIIIFNILSVLIVILN